MLDALAPLGKLDLLRLDLLDALDPLGKLDPPRLDALAPLGKLDPPRLDLLDALAPLGKLRPPGKLDPLRLDPLGELRPLGRPGQPRLRMRRPLGRPGPPTGHPPGKSRLPAGPRLAIPRMRDTQQQGIPLQKGVIPTITPVIGKPT
ncbi:hypothetical protein [Amycolatopsis jejuensis]|uniref:hypothetical protein n=1 Tax=Amycolatopsis jejuensis TaxID=330084 RepID=UPI00068F8A6C|nr:hypothetical protein [Amycolatopsis jejuensis]